MRLLLKQRDATDLLPFFDPPRKTGIVDEPERGAASKPTLLDEIYKIAVVDVAWFWIFFWPIRPAMSDMAQVSREEIADPCKNETGQMKAGDMENEHATSIFSWRCLFVVELMCIDFSLLLFPSEKRTGNIIHKSKTTTNLPWYPWFWTDWAFVSFELTHNNIPPEPTWLHQG